MRGHGGEDGGKECEPGEDAVEAHCAWQGAKVGEE
jgi:hypothetical protein